MKKILVLTVMVLLVAGMSVMADSTVKGQVQYEWFQDMDTVYDYNGDAEIVVQAEVDDFNTATIDFDYAQDGPPATTSTIQLDKAYFTTAIGKYAGLEDMGVSVTLIWGWQEWANEEYGMVTGYENEHVFDAKVEDWQFNIDIGIMDMVHIEAAMSPGHSHGASMFGIYGGMDPIWVEAYYTQEEEALDKGDVGIGANFGMDIMPGMYAFDLGLTFNYNMDSDALDGDQYALGVGLSNTIMEMVYVNVGMSGNDDTIFNLLWFEVGAGYEDMVGADLGVGMWMHEDAPETMDELDISVWTKVGAATFRVGYVMVSEDNYVAWALSEALGGPGDPGYYEGLNAPSDADFNPTISTGMVYFSGTVDF